MNYPKQTCSKLEQQMNPSRTPSNQNIWAAQVPLEPLDVSLKEYHSMLQRVSFFKNAPADVITGRLKLLDKEMDMEKILTANTSFLSLIGIAMGYWFSPIWYLIPSVLLVLSMQYSITGWSPIVGFFKRLGIRKPFEIQIERMALKFIRGDFRGDLEPEMIARNELLERFKNLPPQLQVDSRPKTH